MNYPTSIVEKKYGGKILKGMFWLVKDHNNEVIKEKSYAQISLYDLSELKFPLLWSYSVTPGEAHAALTLFEKTGVTLMTTK